MKYFLLSILLLFSFSTYAGTCAVQINSVSDLSESDRQKMIVQCENAKMAAITNTSNGVTAENVDKWAEIATKFVAALSLVAAEAGRSLNEFLPTPAGILASTLIIWQVMGDDIMHLVACIGIMMVAGFYIKGVAAYRKTLLVTGVDNVTQKGWFGREKTVQVKSYCGPNELSKTKPTKDEMSDHSWYGVVTMFIVGTE